MNWRLALMFAQDIKAETLILNGARDDRSEPEQARLLADRINSHDSLARVHIYPEYGHEIPVDVREREIDGFIEAVLKPSEPGSRVLEETQ